MAQDLTDMLRWLLPVFVLLVAVSLLVRNWTGLAAPPTDDEAGFDLCRGCRYDVRGLERCPECGQVTLLVRRRKLKQLQDRLPADVIEPRVVEPHEEPVSIFWTPERRLIEILREHLIARGIMARIVAPRPSQGTGFRLHVWSEDYDRAKGIVDGLWPKDPDDTPKDDESGSD